MLGSFLVALLCPHKISADDSPAKKTVVAVVTLSDCCVDAAWSTAEQRILQELALGDLQVVPYSGNTKSDTGILRTLAMAMSNGDISGAILLSVEKTGEVRLHTRVLNRESGLPQYSRQVLAASPLPEMVEVVAIKTREAVLAALYQASHTDGDSSVRLNTATGATKPAAPSQRGITYAEKQQKRRREAGPGWQSTPWRVHIEAFFGAAWSPGGIGANGHLGGGVSRRLSSRFTVGVDGWGTVLSPTIETRTASATSRLVVGRLFGAFHFRPVGPLRPRMGIRLGVGHLRSTGKSDVIPVTTASVTLFFIGVFSDFKFQLTNRIAVPLSFGIGALPPGIAVRFEGTPQATLKTLVLESHLGIAIQL
ncbi:MAG: hypothetical protein JXR76_03460 [Deltaproteobacteria bacterium]|nr:hypothetical protein [Deltaproteobacteria bacterium]